MSAPVSRALRVTTAAEARAADEAAIAAGTPSFALMCRAGTEAAARILSRHADGLFAGVDVLAGRGNNGGDAYIVAAQLHRTGVRVRLWAAAPPATADAQRAAALWARTAGHSAGGQAMSEAGTGAPRLAGALVVDGLLGTGHRGALRPELQPWCAAIHAARARGACIVALDLPSGLDADSGTLSDGGVLAHHTITFGTLKRGLLQQRAAAGEISVVDIGLGDAVSVPSGTPMTCWCPPHTLAEWLPRAPWNAHKGVRGRVAIAGGDTGMAGAVILACRAALAAGAGVVHAVVDVPSVSAVQATLPQVIAHEWPPLASSRQVDAMRLTPSETGQAPRYEALAIGPGLGRSRLSSQVLQRLIDTYRSGPLVLDADALWLAADAANALGTDTASLLRYWLRDTPQAVCTPHPGEFARMTGALLPTEWEARVARVQDLADRVNAVVLLKGTPTLVAAPKMAEVLVVPHGTPVLATGGSGDALTGLIVALLGQGATARAAAVVAATVHGVAAECVQARATQSGQASLHGHTLDDVLQALPDAFGMLQGTADRVPADVTRRDAVLGSLPALR